MALTFLFPPRPAGLWKGPQTLRVYARALRRQAQTSSSSLFTIGSKVFFFGTAL